VYNIAASTTQSAYCVQLLTYN